MPKNRMDPAARSQSICALVGLALTMTIPFAGPVLGQSDARTEMDSLETGELNRQLIAIPLSRIEHANSFDDGRESAPWATELDNHGHLIQLAMEPLVWNELFPPDQIDSIRAIAQSYFQERSNLMLAYPWGDQADVNRNTFLDELSQLNEVYDAKIVAALPPEKRQRLGQLFLWNQIRFSGLANFINAHQLRKLLDLNEDQQERLRSVSQSVVEQLEQGILEVESDVIDSFASELSVERKMQLDRLIGSRAVREQCPPMTLQAMMRSCDHEPFRRAEILAGDLQAEPWRDFLLIKYDRRIRYDGSILNLVHHPVMSIVDLSPAQQRSIADETDEMQKSIVELRESLPHWNNRQSEQRFEYVSRLRELEDALSASTLDDILLSEQRNDVLKHHFVLLVRAYGPLPMLADGSLGNRIEITENERRALFAVAPMVKTFIIDAFDDLHRVADEQILEVLNDHQISLMQEALGEQPSIEFRESVIDRIDFLRRGILR